VYVLGIETSCDETAAAVVCSEGTERILSNVICSQIDMHSEYGGVVPEIAARAHESLLFPAIQKALNVAQLPLHSIDAIAATCGPGLIGGVMVGAIAAKMLALAHNIPFIAVNHLEGHAQVCSISEDVTFPYLLLLISGGHSQILEVHGLGKYKLLGETLDDSVGETFDKVARLIGLPYPGGPNIEKRAQKGDPRRFSVSTPLKGRSGCDFSFSGMKTAFRTLISQASQSAPLSEQDVNDFAASLQWSVAEALVSRIVNALKMVSDEVRHNKTFVIAGGVAANKYIRARITEVGNNAGYKVFYPPVNLCTDNAVMIAWVGLGYHEKGIHSSLDFEPRSRWELDSLL
jgi:N6-L-threonylcarbamoyladenine synthase